MNELQRWENEVIHLNEEIYERYERMKADEEWFDTLKFQFKQFAEKSGVTKWETERWVMDYIKPDKPEVRADTERMKNSDIEIVNAETGEVEKVNAYEYFCKKGKPKAPYVKCKEKE